MIDTDQIRGVAQIPCVDELCDAYDALQKEIHELKAQLESEKRWADRYKLQRDQVIEENNELKELLKHRS
jgi:hypothetical protein